MLLSLVVVAHRHQAWVRPFLTSVLDQSSAGSVRPDEVEVVVVDDASPDHTARIVDEIASADPRVRRHRHDTRAGTASSWRTGLALSRGEHVWFLEPTDLLLPGSLGAVLEALTGGPDVLLVPGVDQDLYSGQRPAAAPGRVPLLRDRVLRRAHLDTVPPPHGGELGRVPWATALLNRAVTVHRLDRPVWAHRLLPLALRRRLADGEPWDVAAAYDEALQELAGHPAANAEAPDTQALIAARDLEQRSLQPSAEPARRDLIGRLRAARRTARSAARWVPRNRKAARARLTALRYAANRRGPLDPRLVAYSAYWGAAYSCNPRAIYLTMRELRPQLRGVWVVKPGSEHVLPTEVERVVEGSPAYYRLMARATYLVNNVNFGNDIVKRPGQVHLQTHHGTPLKTMGLDLVHAAHSSLGLNFRRLMKRIARWDYSVSANEFSSEIWERVYPSGTYESLETGYPRNDELARATDADTKRVRDSLGIDPEQRVLLYTPTHREYTKEYVPLLNPVEVAEALGPGWTVLMRSHYFYRGVEAGSHPRVLDVAEHPSIEELSIASDALVTDYSSLMFDYAVLDRPIVIYAPDWEDYRSQRGVYFDLMAEPPGAVATTQDELVDVFLDGRYDDATSTARRADFRARFTALEDGHASERVVAAVWPLA